MSRPSSQVSRAWKARWEPSCSVRLSVSCWCHHGLSAHRPGATSCPPRPVAWPSSTAPQPHLEDVLGDDVVVSQAVQQREDVIHCHGDLGAVQLQQVPQVPLAPRPRHAVGTRPGTRSLPRRAPLIRRGRRQGNLHQVPAAPLISVRVT